MQLRTWLVLTFATFLGCGPAISTSLQQQQGAAPKVSFQELAANPDKYQGRVVILGGRVMRVRLQNNKSFMEVDQRSLDDKLYPAGKVSGGTFWVESDEWLSPSKYQPQSTVTVAGVVAGRRDSFPFLKAKEVHFWEAPPWEEWFYPIPRSWYQDAPELEYWYTPPYWNPWRPGQH
jgi:starvation-inducible outer membrane lipoprotein